MQDLSGPMDQQAFGECFNKLSGLTERAFTDSYVIKDFKGFSKQLRLGFYSISKILKAGQGGI